MRAGLWYCPMGRSTGMKIIHRPRLVSVSWMKAFVFLIRTMGVRPMPDLSTGLPGSPLRKPGHQLRAPGRFVSKDESTDGIFGAACKTKALRKRSPISYCGPKSERCHRRPVLKDTSSTESTTRDNGVIAR